MIAIPDDVRSEQIILRPNGTDEARRLRPDSSEYPLDKLKLKEGLYHVECGDARLSLDLVDGLVETSGDSAGSVSTPGRTTVLHGIYGCAQAESRPVTVPAPSEGEQCVLVGPGTNDLEVVGLPVWLSGLVGEGGLSWTTTAEWLSFEPVWRLTKPGASAEYYEVTRVGDTPPQQAAHGDEWAGLIKQAELDDPDAETAELWRQYVAAAEARP